MTTYATGNDPTTGNTNASDPTKEEIAHLKDDLAALRDDIRALARTASRDAKGMASEQFEHLTDAAGDMAENVRLHAEEYTHGVQEKIREKPLSSVLISVAAGAILAKLILR